MHNFILKDRNMNKVHLIGNLVRDTEIKEVGENKTKLAINTIAVNNRYKTNSGEERNERMFIDLELWGKSADFLQKYGTKGRHVAVEGSLRFYVWDTKDGNKASKHSMVIEEIEFLDRPKEAAAKEEK